MSKKKLYPRYIKPLLLSALKDAPAVLIHGPRQCGKTTLARIVGEPKYKYISFDDIVVAESAKADPIGFVKNLPKKVILDEVQKAPYIFSAIKKEIDNNRLPGRFILTGSANILRLPKLSDSLAGRMQILRLHPLSQGELTGHKSKFLNMLFKGKFETKTSSDFNFKQIIDQIVMGGYPEALIRPSAIRRVNWYRSYIETVIQRDIMDLSQARSIDILPRLLALSATQTSHLVNFTKLSSAFQVSRSTIYDYAALLEQMFFLEKLSPWYSNRLRRFIKTPKLHLCDTGLACALLGLSASALKKNLSLSGQLLETFIFQELRKQASYHNRHYGFFYYRDKKGHEVDVVIERDHLIAGVEVKSSATVNLSDFQGLKKLKTALGKQFVCGVVLYSGDKSIGFGNRLYAIPLNTLWL